jgi:hypothetical protein
MDEDERPTSKLSEKVKEAEETLARAEDELNRANERAAASEQADDPGSPDTADRPA